LESIPEDTLNRWDGCEAGKPGKKIAFGKYEFSFENGILMMKNLLKNRIDLIHGSRIGMKKDFSKDAELILSECKPYSESAGRARFFLLDPGSARTVCVSMNYTEDEAQMRSTGYDLGFRLSGNHDVSAIEGSLIALDRNEKRYVLVREYGETLSAPIKLGTGSRCFMLSAENAVIVNREDVHVIHGDTRDVIEIKGLCKTNGSKLMNPEVRTGWMDELLWLAVKDRKWKKQVLLIALTGKQKFCFCFCPIER
jgi:hypothetical protein